MSGELRRIGSGPSISQAVIHGDVVYLAGQVADDGSAGVADQMRSVLRQVDARLADAGTDRTRLLSVNIWLRDMADFAAMNAVWLEWLDGAAPPARATVQAALADPGWAVEVMATAAL